MRIGKMMVSGRVGMAVAVVALGAGGTTVALGDVTYVALGDSVAFGVGTTPSFTMASDGDRGYVSRYADWLGGQGGGGGVRPRVRNLAIYGEATGGFFDTSNPARQYNTNYEGGMGAVSQSQRFAEVVASEGAMGHTVGHVTVGLGANDALSVWTTLGFILAPWEEQVAITDGLIAAAAANLGAIYAEVRGALPGAEVVTVGYYDPFPALPGHPLAPIAAYAMPRFNQVLQEVSGVYGARYVDVFSAFVGREGELTYLTLEEPQGFNVHCTELGYEVIAGAIVVPGPGGWVVLVVAGGGVLGGRRRG